MNIFKAIKDKFEEIKEKIESAETEDRSSMNWTQDDDDSWTSM